MEISNLLGKITIFVVFCCWGISAQGKYGGGSGTSEDPYLIYDANQMNAIGANPEDWNKHFLMTADIDLTTLQGEEFIIGSRIINSAYFLDFDSQHQMLYWTDRGMWRKNMNTGEMEKMDFLEVGSLGVALDVNDGKMYWISLDVNVHSYVYRSDLDGSNAEEVLYLGEILAWDIDIDPIQHKIYLSTISLDPKIYRANVDGSGFEEIVTLSHNSSLYNVYLALDIIGGKIYFFEINGPTLQRCNLNGSSKEILISSGLDHPSNLVVDNANSRLYWTDYGIDRILSANLDGTDLKYLTSYLGPNPRGIALDTEQGKIYYSEAYYGKISRMNLDGSSRETVCENYFMGVFDGNDFTVRNFINTYESSEDMVGLFGVIGKGAEIRNLNLECDLTVSNSDYAGGLVGVSIYGDVTNCHVNGNILSLSDTYTGGLVGGNGGTITNCSANISVKSNGIAGGLVGTNTYYVSPSSYPGTISNSCSTGSVSGTNRVGGLVGLNDTYSKIYNSYSNALVAGEQYVGGLVGLSYTGSGYYGIFNCYSSGHVSGVLDTGGLVGCITGGADVENCFWDVTTSNQNESAAGTGLTTDLMYQQQTYFDWICEQVWTIDDGNDYPRLYWQKVPGVLLPFPAYGGGKGTENEPYLIYTAEQLAKIGRASCQLDCHYRLMSDVNLSSYSGDTFPIIGYDQEAFRGVFDGMGHTIHCFTYQSENFSYAGLFGRVDEFGQIRNLTLIDPNVVAPQAYSAGSLVGNLAGTLSNCTVRGASVTGKNYVGGLAGHSFGNIIQCSSQGVVIGDSYVGGLVGLNAGHIEESYSDSSINGNLRVGGLIGYNVKYPEPGFDNVDISDSYASGRVQAVERVGGFVGASNTTMRNCWTAAQVQGQTSVGGFVGEIFDVYDVVEVSESCFWDANVNPDLEGIGTGQDPNIVGLPKTEMQIAATFIESGWDFVGETKNGFENIWRMCQDGVDYPRLNREFTDFGDLTCPDGVDFIDYSFLADEWQLEKLQQDYNHDGHIDFKDFSSYANGWDGDFSQLLSFCSMWLSRSVTAADIAPIPGDEIVDWQDLFLLCENWLTE